MRSVPKIEKPKSDNVGERIKYLRCKLEMSQEELGKKIKRIREDIVRFENGTRSIDLLTLKNIAKAMNVSTDYLLGLSNFENANTSKRTLNKLTGLSDDAINNLYNINKYHKKDILNIINYLLEQEKLFPDEYYILKDKNKLTLEEQEKLSTKFKEWSSKNYKKIFTKINDYFNVQVDSEEKIYISNKTLKKENELNDLYDYATSKEILSSKDIADTFLLKQIENTLENAKKDYLIQSKRNEE